MKKLLNLSITLFIVFIVSIIFTTTSFAGIKANVSLKPSKSEFSKKEKIVVNVDISNFNSETGINVLGGVLEYDKTNLEFNTIKGPDNGWGTASYNPENGKFVIDCSGMYNKNGTIFQIVFNAKTENANNVSVKLKNIEVANGDEEVKLTDPNSTSVTIKTTPEDDNGGDDKKDDDNGNGGNNGNNNGNNSNSGNNSGNSNNDQQKDNIANTVLPKAGDLLPIIAGGIILAIIVLNVIVTMMRKKKSKNKTK